MRYFTESPFERMMMQKPSMRSPVKDAAAQAGCEGCGYGQERPCIAVCMRKLTARGEKTIQEQARPDMEPEKGEANETDYL